MTKLNKLILPLYLLYTSQANAETFKHEILLNPSRTTLELHLRLFKDTLLSCETNYFDFRGNGLCKFELVKSLGVGQLEFKGYKELSSNNYNIGVRYKIKW